MHMNLSGRIQGELLRGVPGRVGVLVLAGSSGRVDVERARLFAERGASVLALRWFGGSGQTAGIREVPLEIFSEALSTLVDAQARHLAIVGTSKGAEAALLVACHEPRLDVVVALAPTSVAWAEVGAPGSGPLHPPFHSSWTRSGRPVPFVPYDETWQPPPPWDGSLVNLYAGSLERFPQAAGCGRDPDRTCPSRPGASRRR